ncbi:MAG: protein kinase [Pirellulaceae bacterium]
MAPALTVDSFLDVTRRSRLIPEDKLTSVLQDLEGEGVDVDSPKGLAHALIEKGLLTRWQADYLIQGKHKGFFLGSYRFLNLLGKGGMGAVYLAEHEMMRRRCAIKVLPAKLIKSGSSVLKRFYLEAQAVAALDDPNIVRAYDVNKEVQGKNEIHYLVMEYVEGSDLQKTVRDNGGGLGFVQVADFSRQAASGLSHAHESGLIHRDIKPANLLVDGKGTVKILDLGLARFFDDKFEASLTAAYNDSILGTADYLSPEQALNSHDVDTRTDIYSLGCTCYFMLTGQPPFPEGSVAQRLMSHQVKSPTPIERFRPDVPNDLVAIIDRMISKKPDDRYQTAADVANAFRAWLMEHADDAWKQQHRDMLGEGSGIARGEEPTRATSSATQDTELELGLAPLGEDERVNEARPEAALTPVDEPLVTPTASGPQRTPVSDTEVSESPKTVAKSTSPEPDLLSQPLDPLLTEPLDRLEAHDPLSDSGAHVAMGSGINVAAGSGVNIGVGSGVHPRSGVPAQPETGGPKQLLKLILIGFCVSVPLVVVILLVSSWSASNAGRGEMHQAVGPGPAIVAADPEPQLEPSDRDPPTSPSAETTAGSTPTTGAGDSHPPAQRKAPGGQSGLHQTNRPATPGPGTAQPGGTPPDGSGGTAVSSPGYTGGVAPTNGQPGVSPDGSSHPPPKPPAGRGPDSGSTGATGEKKPPEKGQPDEKAEGTGRPPSPEEIRTFFASLREINVELDHPPKSNIDMMLMRLAKETIEEQTFKASFQKSDDAPAVLQIYLKGEKASDGYIHLTMHAALVCRFTDGDPVPVWTYCEDVGKMTMAILQNRTVSSVLRKNIERFYRQFAREFRDIVSGKK